MSTNLPAEPSPPRELDAARSQLPAEAPPGYANPPVVASMDDDGGVDIRRHAATLLRYKWLIVACTLAGSGAGFALMKLSRPVYRAQATIWVQPGVGARGPIQTGPVLRSNNWLDLLRSFVVLDSVVTEQRLFVTPTDVADTAVVGSLLLKDRLVPGRYELEVDEGGRFFTLKSLETGTIVQRGQPGDSIGSDLGLAWQPPARVLRPGRKVTFSVTAPRQAALDILDRLDVRLPGGEEGNFIRLTLTGGSPSRTAATLNSIANRFVSVADDLKKETLRQFTALLAEQLQQSGAQLAGAEQALRQFQVNTITLPSRDVGVQISAGLQQTQNTVMSNFFQMRMEEDVYRRDRQALQEVLRKPPEQITATELEAIGTVATASVLRAALADLTTKTAALRALQTRYTDEHQEVVRTRDEIQQLQRVTIPTEVNRLVAELQTRERQVSERISSASTELQQIPMRAIEEDRLERERTIAANLYTNLQQRYSEARLAEASTAPDVRVLDPAVVPNRALASKAQMMFLMGVAGGLGFAVVLALVLDRFDRRVRYPDQVTKDLGLTILGAIPRAKINGGGLRGDDAAQVVEALRNIRLNLIHAYGAAGPLVTTITSPGPGDGKSFLSSNLALAFADAGHRTLLIDGDIRRGALHRVLNVNRKPGLLDYLGGQAERHEVIQSTRLASVDFIGCGTRKMGGPELLASPAMSQLLIHLRSQYGVIIIDSPPLGAGVDPLVLGSLSQSVLLVLRTGVTDRELAAAKLDHMDRLPIRILGAVLNDVKPEGVYKYYSYLPGYRSEEESEVDDLRRLPAIKS